VGWFANTPTLSNKRLDVYDGSLMSMMTQSSGGILPKDSAFSPLLPNPSHIEQCCLEIGWIATLITSQSLGNKSDLDGFVTYVINKAARLESRAKKPFLSSTKASIDEIVSQFWHGVALKSDPQREDYSCCSFPFELSSLLVPNEMTEALILSPSTPLLQACSLMLQVHAIKATQKKALWNRLWKALDTIITGFKKDALESETKTTTPKIDEKKSPQDGGDLMSQFASLFGSDGKADQVSCEKEVNDSQSAYLRESSCFIILSCMIARSKSNSSLIHLNPDMNIGLNKTTREKVCHHYLLSALIL
jgi:hypothetical protein